MKCGYVIYGLFLLGGLLLGLFVAFSVTRCIRSALVFSNVSLATVNDKPALVVSVQEHPPWAHSNMYGIDFDYDNHIINVAEFYVLWHPFSPRVLGRPPIVIQQGLLTGSYTLRLWNGQEYAEAGRVIVGEKGNIEWHPKEEAR